MPNHETVTTIERAVALEAVLANAPEVGIETALDRFGGALTPTERKLVSSLSVEEIGSLNRIETKLSAVQARRANNNNNNNNTRPQ
jgi:hypothetical protein